MGEKPKRGPKTGRGRGMEEDSSSGRREEGAIAEEGLVGCVEE